jgi:hypothetical protein
LSDASLACFLCRLPFRADHFLHVFPKIGKEDSWNHVTLRSPLNDPFPPAVPPPKRKGGRIDDGPADATVAFADRRELCCSVWTEKRVAWIIKKTDRLQRWVLLDRLQEVGPKLTNAADNTVASPDFHFLLAHARKMSYQCRKASCVQLIQQKILNTATFRH